MRRRLGLALAAALTLTAVSTARTDAPHVSQASQLVTALDRIFDDPALSRALVGVRIESARDGRILYLRENGRHLIPASNMKLVTMAVAAARLGWDHRFETRLEATGDVVGGTLTGDLIVVGGGDPSIGSPDGGSGLLFLEWADALREAGIRRVAGRIIGDDNAFDDEALGAGWAWDNLSAAYAAPSGALSFNENAVAVEVTGGPGAGAAAQVTVRPVGAPVVVASEVVTSAPASSPSVVLNRSLDGRRLTVRGQVPARGSSTLTMAVGNPTAFFVGALDAALAERGITVAGGAHDIDDVQAAPASTRRLIARRESPPLSVLGGRFMKASQNFYGEMLLKATGRQVFGLGTAENGRRAARETLEAWGVPDNDVVMYDGSGLSRYNYVTADAIAAVLRSVWNDPILRGPFVALLPVAGRDGTLASRMRTPPLLGRVQAKTGTLNHVRALSGYVTLPSGERVIFSAIANHFTAPSADVDAIVERALAEVMGGTPLLPSSAPGLAGEVAEVLVDERLERRRHVLGSR